jgi:hypothetical protein
LEKTAKEQAEVGFFPRILGLPARQQQVVAAAHSQCAGAVSVLIILSGPGLAPFLYTLF